MFFCLFLPNKLVPYGGVSLFKFSASICPRRHHENSAIPSGWKLQEYLALSPEDCRTNYILSKFNLVNFLIIEQTHPTLRYVYIYYCYYYYYYYLYYYDFLYM